MVHTDRMRNPRIRGLAGLLTSLLTCVALTSGCGGDDEVPEPTASTPAGFDLPAGVKLTAPGTTVKVGKKATFVYQLDDGVASAVTAKVTAIDRGAIEDFAFFSLDADSKASTPYYVKVTLTNDGPAGLGGAAPPFVVHDDQNSIAPPNTVTGTFKPCENRSLPKTLLPGKSAEVCMVFLLPKGRTLVSIDARSADDAARAVRWKP